MAFIHSVSWLRYRRALEEGGIAVLLVSAIGCGGAREQPAPNLPAILSTGVAAADCAPWDGSATSIFLSDSIDLELLPPAPPYLHLIVYEPGGRLPGREVRLGRLESGSGLVVRCAPDGGCATSNRGVITFDAGAPEGTLGGSYTLLFSGDTVAGTFIVRWSARAAICG